MLTPSTTPDKIPAMPGTLKFGLKYSLIVGLPALGILAILRLGPAAVAPASARAASRAPVPAHAALPDVGILLLQIGLVLLATRLVGRLFRKLGQPQVVGEMTAGLLLGPSLLGWIAPAASSALFAPDSLGFLNALCQVGLVLFMFLVGVELEPALLRGHGHTAVLTSHASILAPFFLGVVLAVPFYPRLAPPGVAFASFALFLGAAMSVTAFPVLARILTERKLHRTSVGAVALVCAAVDDVTAWCILAGIVIVARAGRDFFPLWRVLGGCAIFVAVMITGGRRIFRAFGRTFARRGSLSADSLAAILLCAFVSAWAAELIGIHALFGAFLAGAVMPREPGFARALTQKLEDLVVVVLLPLFFAFTGLRTSVRLLGAPGLWLSAALVLVCAIAGKLGGSALAARSCGMPWREAAGVGVLMNTRGLMELVILNVGLDIGVISPALFTMMVLMALVTTAMTSPLLAWISPAAARSDSPPAPDREKLAPSLIT
jgi:Kef-type K+ transport system membrane component KefB